MLRTITLMLSLAAIAVLVVATVAHSETLNIVRCKEHQSCKGTGGSDWIFGTSGNDRILPMSGEDYVFGNGGNDAVAHSYDADMIFGGCGSDTVRGGGGPDTIYANMPTTLRTDTSTCRAITDQLDSATIAAIKALDPDVQAN